MVGLTHNQGQMVYWIEERDLIRQRKEAGEPKPWSDNPVMQSTYFCNVNREDDRVTKWIRQNWTYPTFTDDFDDVQNSHQSYDFSMMVARIFNQPETLAELCQPIDGHLDLWLENAETVLYDRHRAGKRIWNGAYIVSTNGKKMDKRTYCLWLLSNVAQQPDLTSGCETLAEAHKKLCKIEGLASFMAGQILADLKNTPYHRMNDVDDWFTFSAPGPGSLRGLSWFFEVDVTKKTYQYHIDKAYDMLHLEVSDSIADILCHQNLQNTFCEYSKYMKVLKGTGRSKRKYNGG